MAEPAVEVKSEDEPVAKKIKLAVEDNKNENGDTKTAIKEEEKVEVKKENGTNSANGTKEKETAEDRNDPDVEDQIVCQVEYYFGNFNLPKDKFLQEQIKLEDGWVPLDVMLRCQRLAALTRNPSTVIKALKNSSQLMEVNEEANKIRRSPNKPLPERNEEWQKQITERSVYCKGFPQTETSLNTYIEFFKPHGPVENINLRRYLDKATQKYVYKGSIYVTFESKELAEKFLALESVTYGDKELIRMTQAAHLEETKREREEKWGKKVRKNNSEEDKGGKSKKELPKGCILHIAGINNEEVTREIIKSALVDLGADVAYIQFAKGDKEAHVRLQSAEEGAATKFIKKLEDGGDKVKLCEDEVELKLLEGEEEEQFLKKTRESMENRNKNHGHKGRQHHKGGHRGGFRGNKRGRSPANKDS